MASRKVWGSSDDDSIEYASLTRESLDQALEVMRNSFFVDEKVSIAVELHKNPAARRELEDLSLRAAHDGLSLVAIDKAKDKVVAVAFNKLQVLNSDQTTYFDEYNKSCKESSSKALIQFMIDADGSCDLFKLLNVDCMLELMFVATLPAYRGQGICGRLIQYSIDAAKMTKSGTNCKVSITDEPLKLEPVPKAVSAIYTSPITQRMGKRLGFKVANEISYTKFQYNGKTFADRLDPESKSTTVEYYVI